MKKIFSFVLVFFLFVSPSFALSKTPTQAANFLAKLWIIVYQSADATKYELDASIQRQAVIKVVMKLSGKNVPDVCRGEFNDVSKTEWPCKYIEAALDAGYIAKNSTFRPFDNITKTEAMKLVLKAKWVQKIQTTDTWQADYMQTAFFYGIIDEKYSDYDGIATRGWIFQIATATIEKESEIMEKGGIISDEAL